MAKGSKFHEKTYSRPNRKEARAMTLEEIKAWWDSTSPTRKEETKEFLRNFNSDLLATSWDNLDEDTQNHLILLLM